jgi:hypothetical protein
MNENRFEPFLKESECLRYLVSLGICDRDIDRRIEQVNKRLEDWKVELFTSAFNSKNQKQARRQIKSTKNQIEQLHQKRHHFDHLTLKGYARLVQSEFILLKNLTDPEGRIVYDCVDEYGHDHIQMIYNKYLTSKITSTQFRAIARSAEWQDFWGTSKTRSFRRKILTSEQRELARNSIFYDNIRKNPKCPSDDVIEGDDMLDGWIIMTNRKAEQEKAQNRGDDLAAKHGNPQELFIVANSEDDITNINRMNDLNATMVKKQRKQQVATGGKVKDSELMDQKIARQKQTNEQFKEALKRTK